ncbi:hypothetical protein ACE3MQ_24930 [Paenibacillus lentus]|uniref:hypothetical protein n=1 Tax=Paenibacillus lentus TaxID=1338368 RepID=UPI003663633E
MAKGITLQELDSTATSRLVIKDSAGRAKVTAPLAADDIALKSTVDNVVGNLSTLQTTDKSNVVKAINELFTNVSDGKTRIASAITGKGIAALGSDTFAVLAQKIGQIVTGKRFATGTFTTPATTTDENFSSYTNGQNNLVSYPVDVVTGIDFVPTIYIVRESDDPFGSVTTITGGYRIYFKHNVTGWANGIQKYSLVSGGSVGSPGGSYLRRMSEAEITTPKLVFTGLSRNTEYTWWAWE